jgi:hypothetical protein
MPVKTTSADTSAAVDAFMATLDHPHKDAVAALRKIVAGADPSIEEGIKWKSPSFRTAEYFATTHLRAKKGVGLILHLGAKPREGGKVAIDDPDGLLTWLAKDRAMVSFDDAAQVKARAKALAAIVRLWIKAV